MRKPLSIKAYERGERKGSEDWWIGGLEDWWIGCFVDWEI